MASVLGRVSVQDRSQATAAEHAGSLQQYALHDSMSSSALLLERLRGLVILELVVAWLVLAERHVMRSPIRHGRLELLEQCWSCWCCWCQ